MRYLWSEFSFNDNLRTQETVEVGSERKGGLRDMQYLFAEKHLVHNPCFVGKNMFFSTICYFFSFSPFFIA